MPLDLKKKKRSSYIHGDNRFSDEQAKISSYESSMPLKITTHTQIPTSKRSSNKRFK